jgi:hypothetical protein
MVRPVQAALVARRIGRVSIGLYAHRDYLATRGTPRTIEELSDHSLIGFDRNDMAMRALAAHGPHRALGLALTRGHFSFRSDSNAAQFAALRAGFGIGAAQAGIAARDPALVPVLPDSVEFGLDMWLAMHEDLRASRRVRLVYDHLVHGLADYVASADRPALPGGSTGRATPTTAPPPGRSRPTRQREKNTKKNKEV